MKKKAILWTAGGLIAAAALLIGVLSAVNGYFVLAPAVQLTLNGDAAVEVAAHTDYVDEGFAARKGKNDLSADVVTDNPVDTTIPGTYTVTYTLTVKEKTYTQQRTVTVVDKTAPVLELQGETELKLAARKFYEEAGYTATDLCDGDLTDKVTVTETLEGELLTVTYTVVDAAGNEANARRLITVRDVEPPVLKLKGYSTMYVARGKTYRDPGCKATDDVDGDIASAVVVSGSVDTSTVGTYTLTYRVSDQGGNEAEITRKVKVYKAVSSSSSRVYLTFDDGPSSNVTPQILDVLAESNVKATFFIVNYSSSDKHLIRRMIDEGHTVGIHGYSHDYATIYADDEAFMNNIYRLRDKLLADFGYHATIIRFPGGSSNTVSAYYNEGIMTRLTERVQEEGFVYFDWNVSSGDASGSGISKSQVYRNVTKNLSQGYNNVVLMHDSGAKQTTADAVQDIIDYARGNGYVLLPLTPGTPPVHHGISN